MTHLLNKAMPSDLFENANDVAPYFFINVIESPNMEELYLQNGSVPMFPGTYVPRYPCSPVPMFPEPMFPGTYVPRYI